MREREGERDLVFILYISSSYARNELKEMFWSLFEEALQTHSGMSYACLHVQLYILHPYTCTCYLINVSLFVFSDSVC